MIGIVVKKIRINGNEVQKVVKRKSFRAIERAVASIRKYVQRSIPKRSGRKKTAELKAYFPGVGGAMREGGTMTEHLAKSQGSTRTVVRGRGRQRSDRNPEASRTYFLRKGSSPGRTPHSWKAQQPGWKNYYLRDTVKYEVDQATGTGRVISNPWAYGKDKKRRSTATAAVPQIMEKGGVIEPNRYYLAGYLITRHTGDTGFSKKGKAYKRQYRQTRLSYSRFWKTLNKKRITVQPRPYMEPALVANLKKIPEGWSGSIGSG